MPAAGGEAADQRRRRCRLPLPLLPLLLCLAAPAAAQSPAPGPAQQEADPEAWRHLTGTVTPDEPDVFLWRVEPLNGTNPALVITLTHEAGAAGGDLDIYCNAVSSAGYYLLPSPEYGADFSSNSIGVNTDLLFIPPQDPDDFAAGKERVYACAIWSTGADAGPIAYKLSRRYEYNDTSMDADEQALARQLFDRCCQAPGACEEWKALSEAAYEGNASANANAVPPDTDLCGQFGSFCEDGQLVTLNAQGWNMSCPFPGDLFSQFPRLQQLHLGFNSFTGDLEAALASLAPLPDLQELSLYKNKLTGRVGGGGALCDLAQGGLESLQLGGMGLAGSVPPCLFDADSTLYQFSAANNQLEGTIPDAFGATIRLQLLNVGSNRLGGSLPPTLAGLASLQILDVTANNLTGELPPFSASKDLTALYASQNAFSGALPDGLAAHPSLRTLELGDNQLSGLPARWGQAPGAAVDMPLRYLSLGLNPLNSAFPQGLAAYPNLTYVRMNSTGLSGALPNPAPGQFPALRYFDVSNNRLTGSIPPGWAGTGVFSLPPLDPLNPAAYNVFAAENNQLSGTIPDYMIDVPVRVYLQGNSGLALPSMEGGGEAGSAARAGQAQAGAQEPASGDTSSGLSGGAIAGIVIGCLLGVAALAGAAVWYRGRRQRATFSWEQGAAAAGGSGGARSSFGRQGSSFKRFEDDAAAAAAAEQARAPAPVYGAAPSAGRQHVELSSQV